MRTIFKSYGMKSADEIEELERMGCDVQLGMALYTNKVSLKNSFMRCLDWKKVCGMVPVIAQDARSSQVLMMGYANKEALEKTFDTKKLTFFSRTRNVLWTKGETSGHFLEVVLGHFLHDFVRLDVLLLVQLDVLHFVQYDVLLDSLHDILADIVLLLLLASFEH